jgi:hypothetical protein
VGQLRIAGGTILLHGDAPLCATYLAAAGLGRLLCTGAAPALSAHDPGFRLERAVIGDPADVVLDLGDGAAFTRAGGPALWGGAHGRRILLGTDPAGGAGPEPSARALLETLAAGEALRLLLGLEPHRYDFEL